MLPEELVEEVLSQAQSAAKRSWEYGTVFEALLEYHHPSFSVFNDPFPDGKLPALDEGDVAALKYVKSFIITDGDQLCEGNGSSSDPTSLLIPALLLSHQSPVYLHAAQRQLHTLLSLTPRYPNGAISHRSFYPSLWADFIYMVPPALAYFAIHTDDIPLARVSVRQCRLYCEVLKTNSGCWKHIVNDEEGPGRKKDEGLWSTSNGWVAAGMCRVLASLRNSRFKDDTRKEQKSLIQKITGILDGAMALDTDPSGLLRNRLDDESWFGEAAGTSLLAATCMRIAVLEPGLGGKYMQWAEEKMKIVLEKFVDRKTGVVSPVVNPKKDEQRTPLEGVSPEAQAFVVLMYAAWRDWVGWRDMGHSGVL